MRERYAAAASAEPMRVLAFEERVEAQEAIERVHDAHRIWPAENTTPRVPFETRVPKALIETKVLDTLRKNAALEDLWHRPITTAELQAELDRMARDTKDPVVLQELFDALGNDPVVIAECLARPALAERLLHACYAHDRRLHEGAWSRAERALREIGPEELESYPEGDLAHVLYVAGVERERRPNLTPPDTGPTEHTVSRDELERLRTEVGPADGTIRMRDREDSIQLLLVRRAEAQALEVLVRTFPKEDRATWWRRERDRFQARLPRADGAVTLRAPGAALTAACDVWSATSRTTTPPDPRSQHTAVWTGSEMIVWGGIELLWRPKAGGRYDPATDTWSEMAATARGCPSPRAGHTAVWTGREMIVWGGANSQYQNTGSRYDPATDTWRPMSTAGAPAGREDHSAVWTGSEMIVWGGTDGALKNTGGRYDPSLDAWTPTSTAGCPSARRGHTAVWTGREMIVWGGLDGTAADTGGRYDAVLDRWTATSTLGSCPVGRYFHTAVWTGSEMIVWGGTELFVSSRLDSGGRYDPAADTWAATSTASPCPSARESHSAVWTGSEMIVWGGDAGVYVNTGGRYDPATDTWTPTSSVGACPVPRKQHTAVWTGAEMIVWGGDATPPTSVWLLSSGGRYSPATDSWSPTTTGAPVPAARVLHTAVWTGMEMIVWGGTQDELRFWNTGGRYVPATNSWTATSTAWPCPSGRDSHTAVWTGTEMIVWGGRDAAGRTATGGRYDPAADDWAPTSTAAPSPTARTDHTAVWTGREMLVWGGRAGAPLLTGGRYDPATDSWRATSTGTPCPAGRTDHTAVWTGSEMIVWGGKTSSAVRTGGRYDPATDSWTATSTAALCPSARFDHTAVWTGTEMIVWGGFFGQNTGGRYVPATDTWTATSTGAPCPAPRHRHSAVWSGREMIVWGGLSTVSLDTGGRYDPGRDRWTATTRAVECPSPRSSHTAVFGSAGMIVWGGFAPTASGAVYRVLCVSEDAAAPDAAP